MPYEQIAEIQIVMNDIKWKTVLYQGKGYKTNNGIKRQTINIYQNQDFQEKILRFEKKIKKESDKIDKNLFLSNDGFEIIEFFKFLKSNKFKKKKDVIIKTENPDMVSIWEKTSKSTTEFSTIFNLDTLVKNKNLIKTFIENEIEKNNILSVEEIKKQIQNFKKEFNIEKLISMNPNETKNKLFVHDKDKKNMAYWLEFKNDNVFNTKRFGSISGGSAYKFVLFKKKSDGKWKTGSSKKGETLRESEADELSVLIREKLIKGYKIIERLIQNEEINYNEIQENIDRELDSFNLSKLGWVHKLYSLYFPEVFDDFHNFDLQNEILKKIKIPNLGGFYSNGKIFKSIANKLELNMSHLSYFLYNLEDFYNTYKDQFIIKNKLNLNYLSTILYGPPGTGKTYKVLKDIEKINKNLIDISKISQFQTLDLKSTFWHLAPGRNGHLWSTLKEDNYLGYEWCGKYHGDLKRLPKDTDHYLIIKRFSEVKKGDYFFIIRGSHCLAIAEVLQDYNFEEIKNNPYDFQTVKVKWIEQFETPILLDTTSTVPFSRVGDSRWESLKEGLKEKSYSFNDGEKQEEAISRKYHSFTSFHQSYCYEDFVEGIKPKLKNIQEDETEESNKDLEYEISLGVFYKACDKAAQLSGYSDLQEALNDNKNNRKKLKQAKPFYFIIDEINRGNIANIFGELITLIEDDKRLGAENEIILTLPYSKKKFGVPANLKIIGTMNTADRSVEVLDSALRRRFAFVEMMPKPEILNYNYKVNGIELDRLLKSINDRMEVLIDRDHTIGHSYFMNIKDKENPIEEIKEIFKNKIIPLLEEYFYGDIGKIRLILGDKFVSTQENNVEFMVNNSDDDEYDIEELKAKRIYKINDLSELKIEDFISIYEKTKNDQSL